MTAETESASQRKWVLDSHSDVVFERFPSKALDDYDGWAGAPPTIALEGRILPKTPPPRFRVPSVLESLHGAGAGISSCIMLERDTLFLYELAGKILLLNTNRSRSVSATTHTGAIAPNPDGTIPLSSGATVTIDGKSYIWQTSPGPLFGLNWALGMLMVHDKDKLIEEMPAPEEGTEDPTRWMLGRWSGGQNPSRFEAEPLFSDNRDEFLAGGGTLIFDYEGMDVNRHHQFGLILARTQCVPFFVRPHLSASWQQIDWPAAPDWVKTMTPSGQVETCRLNGILVVGLDNRLVLGTTLYTIKTALTP